MSILKLPPGWRVELLGLIRAVEFSHPSPERTMKLLWVDGEWSIVHGSKAMPASGVPKAKTMAEARKVGTEFLVRAEGEWWV